MNDLIVSVLGGVAGASFTWAVVAAHWGRQGRKADTADRLRGRADLLIKQYLRQGSPERQQRGQ